MRAMTETVARRSKRRSVRRAMLLGVAIASQAGAQSVVRLGAPQARLAEEFTQVAGVREQPNGLVLIVDPREQRIVRADLTTGRVEMLGRSGRGPGEYTVPMSAHALAGDTTIVPDMSGSGRALVITSRGVSTQSLQSAGIRDGEPLFTGDSHLATDANGRLYDADYPVFVRDGRPMSSDSLAVVRLDRATGRRDTVARVHGKVKSPLIALTPSSGAAARAGGGNARRAGGPVPFVSVDQWAVARDGRVAVVSVVPYRVRFYAVGAAPIVGPEIAFTPVRVTGAEKAAWRAAQARPVLGLVYGANGQMSPFSSARPVVEPAEWPDHLPPFAAPLPFRAVRFAWDGTLWVERSVAAGQPPRFDVFDRAGRVTRQVELPLRTRLVGFGERTLYLVRLDEDDIERLERHAMP